VVAADRLAARRSRSTASWACGRVVGDDRVGGHEDRRRRAVVLLELDDGRLRVVVLELEDVADVGATPRVDRLVVVAHHHEVAVLGGEQVHDRYCAWFVSWYSST
jgi:hypothetical protein